MDEVPKLPAIAAITIGGALIVQTESQGGSEITICSNVLTIAATKSPKICRGEGLWKSAKRRHAFFALEAGLALDAGLAFEAGLEATLLAGLDAALLAGLALSLGSSGLSSAFELGLAYVEMRALISIPYHDPLTYRPF